MLIVCGGALKAGWMPFTFLPRIDADGIMVKVELPINSTREDAENVLEQLTVACNKAIKDSGGNAFTTGVTTNGTAGSAGATVVIVVPTTGTMPARYYCTSHGNGMGNTIATQTNDIATVAQISSDVTTVASNIGTISQKATVDEATALAIALGG